MFRTIDEQVERATTRRERIVRWIWTVAISSGVIAVMVALVLLAE